MLYLGIDQHHRQIPISLRNEEGTVIQRRQVSTRPEKTRAFLNEVSTSGFASDVGHFGVMVLICGFARRRSFAVRLHP